MASTWYTKGLYYCFQGAISLSWDVWDQSTLYCMLVENTYTPDPDHEFVSFGVSDSPFHHEISVDGYVGGYNGAGRKPLGYTLQVNNADNRLELVIDDETWSNLGVGATIGGAVIFNKDNVVTDATSPLVAFIDFPDVVTNTGNVTIDFSTSGNLRINVI